MNAQSSQSYEQIVKYRQDLVEICKSVKNAELKFHSQSIQRYKLEKTLTQFKQQLERGEEKMKELVAAKSEYEAVLAGINEMDN